MASANPLVLSEVTSSLDDVHKTRYMKKLKQAGLCHDPYSIPPGMFIAMNEATVIPDMSYPDICNYLVYTKSEYTAEDMKAHKSLAAYSYFVSGFVSPLHYYCYHYFFLCFCGLY